MMYGLTPWKMCSFFWVVFFLVWNNMLAVLRNVFLLSGLMMIDDETLYLGKAS
jgi:hypothetical protein